MRSLVFSVLNASCENLFERALVTLEAVRFPAAPARKVQCFTKELQVCPVWGFQTTRPQLGLSELPRCFLNPVRLRGRAECRALPPSGSAVGVSKSVTEAESWEDETSFNVCRKCPVRYLIVFRSYPVFCLGRGGVLSPRRVPTATKKGFKTESLQ